MKPTVLLTGGFGNLGCRIAAEIHRSGNWNIRLATRSVRPPPPWAPAAEVVNLDLRNSAEIEIACTGVSAIIHLAALNDREAFANPELAELVSGAGTQLLVQAGTRAGINRFLFMSTAHVYGSPLTGTINELSPTHCTHPYGTSHLSGELAVKQAHDDGNFLGIRIRCANGFGFPLDPTVNIWHVLVNDLCNQVASSGSMTLRSSGLQERNFIPIADICATFLHFLHLDVQSVGDGLFNLGSPKSMSVLEMAKVIAERSRTVLHIDPPINRPLQTEPEILIPLDYRIDKLIASGFVAKNNLNFELDQLLELSRRFAS